MSSNNPWVVQAEVDRATYRAQWENQSRFWDQQPIYQYGGPISYSTTDYQFTWNASTLRATGPLVEVERRVEDGPDLTGKRFCSQETGQIVQVIMRSPHGRGDVWEVTPENTRTYRPTTMRLTERDLYRDWTQL